MIRTKCCYAALLVFSSSFLSASLSAQEIQLGASTQGTLQHPRPAETQDEQATAETSLWDSVKDKWEAQGYNSYLAKYPDGRFKSEALARLTTLLGESYVSLLTKQLQVNTHWASVERQLKRSAEIIPSLVEVLDLADVQELEHLGPMAGARSRLLNAIYDTPAGERGFKSPKQKRAVIDAANDLAEAIRKLFVYLEENPQFHSDEKVTKLLDELSGTENRISVARRDYNTAAQEYNDTRRHGQLSAVA